MKKVLISLFLCTAGALYALDPPRLPFAPPGYVCCRTTRPLIIDGNLGETDWQRAAWSDAFVDIEGDLKPRPRFNTRVKMLWDDHYFYIAGQMEEPDVWANLREHDSIIFYDNDFEVFIDPDGDTHRYYELELNAFATHWDLFLDRPYRDGGNPTFFWDIRGLQKGVVVQGSINQPGDIDTGWTIELALPWAVLKEQAPEGRAPGAGDHWRVNFSRVEWRTRVENGSYVKITDPATGKSLPEDNWVWAPTGLINIHYPELWGFVRFSSRPAGDQSEKFVLPEAEQIKWLLRQIYYRQRHLYQEKGSYAQSWSGLKLQLDRPAGCQWPPRLYAGPESWEAVLTASDGDTAWHIRHDGLIWPTASKKERDHK